MDEQPELRKLPRIDRLSERPEVAAWVPRFGRARVIDALRAHFDEAG
ncbi:MAG: hypothetical protein ACK4N5_13345 [Myxococcales bacterium]